MWFKTHGSKEGKKRSHLKALSNDQTELHHAVQCLKATYHTHVYIRSCKSRHLLKPII